MNEQSPEYDVLILGSGLAGSLTAAILARHGAKVMLIDAAQHPRFAVGESTTPQTVEWLYILAERYDVPEIRALTSAKSVNRDIAATSGVKSNFGFVYHHPGQEPDPREATQFALPKIFLQNGHLFRQDTDSYMFHVAVKYGARARQNWRATDIDFDDDGVSVTGGRDGEVLRARYLVDASGFRSMLADKFDLRDTRTALKHHARGMFNHYVGVTPFDEVSGHPKELRPPKDWHTGTLHHVFERGWLWIIPFDNHQGSNNLLCSVGLTIDERTYPRPADLTPQQEFDSFLDRYPAIKRQFTDARPVREWVSAGRMQYSSRQTVGDRWCLMSHAAGFIDPLFSRGLSNTFEIVDALSARLIGALKDGDFSAERFAYVEELEHGLIKWNDELVNTCYIGFDHPRLWNAVFRLWGAMVTPATMRLTRARLRFVRDGDPAHFEELEKSPHPGLWWPTDSFKNLIEQVAETCEKYEAGQTTADEAADRVFTLLQESEVVNPVFGWKDEQQRFIWPDLRTMARFLYWASAQAPPELRQVGREFLMGIVKAGSRVRKLL
ncbi:NAD(P)/FAD-dependent oxidoreductase [Streptomyces phytophilus]|uniref:NAD(P)/FAD-dependent oxidoreductase n=1 Tax=Streptomyces phytophilus TaxID=722715 RepID=UPI0015F05CDA|nr:NAD(P)/FAD-dependent oxidoreductase [Streptomyces phytophilus]